MFAPIRSIRNGFVDGGGAGVVGSHPHGQVQRGVRRPDHAIHPASGTPSQMQTAGHRRVQPPKCPGDVLVLDTDYAHLLVTAAAEFQALSLKDT